MKKAIIFDLYGTLVDIHTDENNKIFWSKFEAYLLKQGFSYDNLQDRYQLLVKESLRLINNDYPDFEILEVFQKLYKGCSVEVSEQDVLDTALTFRKLSTKHITLYDGAIELLDDLRLAGYKVILLSNAQQSFTNYELEKFNLKKRFDSIYLSSNYQMCKPNPNYFNHMLETEKLESNDCIYVGNDHIADVEGAKGVGMDVIYLHTNCSHEILPEFDCLLKVNPGNLNTVNKYIKKYINS